MQNKSSNKAVESSSTKSEDKPKKSTEKQFSFPKYNKVITASSQEEAQKQLNKELGKSSDGDDKE